ncbi:MAG: hypothetical protein IPM54_17350 [Polyangiaceae bacterium]|nr:hypothetical protein [Polyangiaceae bacterium]
MNSERTGGAFLLQEQEPKRLVGIFVSTTTDQFPGWIWGAFGDQDPRCKHGPVTEIAVSRDVALHLAGLLQVLVAQNMWLRGESNGWEFVGGTPVTFSVRIENGTKGMVLLSWETGGDGIAWNEKEGEVEWGLREDRALGLSHALIFALARTAAGIGVPSIESSSAFSSA